jgi:hypothetical protein
MTNGAIDWYFITDQIYRKNFTPIIGSQLLLPSLFKDIRIESLWAESIGYPLANRNDLAHIAQFYSITQQDRARAKARYLQFLKHSLFELAEQDPQYDQAFLSQVRSELRGLTFSQLAAERLGRPDFGAAHPLAILASLDIPIYLTTSPFELIEAALRSVGKTPRTQVYSWQDGLVGGIPAEYHTDPDFEPDVQTPLVYHLHGLDIFPASLVLTEDDYLEFLINVTQDFNTSIVPSTIRNALNTSLLLLLGYDAQSWDLRVLLQGLIKGDRPLRPRSFAIQLDPSNREGIVDAAQFEAYLREYFGQAHFDIFWGAADEFVQTLWQEWEAG